MPLVPRLIVAVIMGVWALSSDANPSAVQRSDPPELPITIPDGGFARTFEIARDEIYIADQLDLLPSPRPTTKAVRDHAAALSAARAVPAALVLYEVGAERSPRSRRILTHKVLVHLDTNADPSALARAAGVVSFHRPDFTDEYAVFHAEDALGAAFDLADQLRSRSGVRSAEPMLKRLRFKRYIPDDPLFSQQWHLRNTGQGGGTAGIDIRVTNVWAQGILGSNVVIGVVDDGVQYTHPDLSTNYVAAYSRNWNGLPGGELDPAPGLNEDHGTACAGLISARGNNAVGISGVAPLSQFSGLRLIAAAVTDGDEAEAMSFSNQQIHVKSNSWGPLDDGDNLEAPGPLTQAALSNSVITGRGGLGTIHVWAGGNGLEENDNANYDGYANSIYTISIAAINKNGTQAAFSEPGACHVVTAPGVNIVTTALTGEGDYTGQPDYTDSFSGTSAATPIVSGIVALMLEAKPDLGWRDVQEILIATARRNDPSDTDWKTNAFGYTFNHKYGSGLVDANAAVTAALTWTNLGAQVRHQMVQTNLNIAIPDNDHTGITRTFNVTNNVRVEHVTATIDIAHTYRGDLTITLTSPSGMTSTLAETRDNDGQNNYPNWTFMTTHKWGEASEGVWEVNVADLVSEDTGTLIAVRLDFFGTDDSFIIPPPVSSNLVNVLDEPFDGGLPAGWSITTNGHPSAYWRFDNPSNRDNYVGDSNPFAIADSDHAGEVNMDTSLQTPVMNLVRLSTVYLAFDSDIVVFEQATADVDVSLNGANGPWTNVWRQTNDLFESQELIDISAIAGGQPNVMIRFRYYDANYDWWWQVDNIEVYGYEVDSDGDGIADAWELYYFGNLETADAMSDYSDNGFSDLHAFLANTDPTNSNSLLRLEHQMIAPGGGFTIQWQSAAERFYRVGRSTNLPHFSIVDDGLPSTPPLNTYDDLTATNSAIYFYRIELDL